MGISAQIEYDHPGIQSIIEDIKFLLEMIFNQIEDYNFDEKSFHHILNMFHQVWDVVTRTNHENKEFAHLAWIEIADITVKSEGYMLKETKFTHRMIGPILKSLKIHGNLRKVALSPKTHRDMPMLSALQKIKDDLEERNSPLKKEYQQMVDIQNDLIQTAIQFSPKDDGEGIPLELHALNSIWNVFGKLIQKASVEKAGSIKALIHELDPFLEKVVHSLRLPYLLFIASLAKAFMPLDLTTHYVAITKEN